eukprot:RCo036956
MVWLHPHPPLTLLDPRWVWVPEGADWRGGLNDRHAVCNRSAAEVYFGRWDALLSGSASSALCLRNSNAELFLRVYLGLAGISVARLPSVAFLACCPTSSHCWRKVCFQIGKDWGQPEDWVPPTARSAKELTEAHRAFANARWLRRHRHKWCVGDPPRILHLKDPFQGKWGSPPPMNSTEWLPCNEHQIWSHQRLISKLDLVSAASRCPRTGPSQRKH